MRPHAMYVAEVSLNYLKYYHPRAVGKSENQGGGSSNVGAIIYPSVE